MRVLYIIMFFCAGLNAAAQGPPVMAKVNGGSYVPLYSLDSQKTAVRPFLMDIYPVTNLDFKKFVRANLSWSRSNIKAIYTDNNYLQHWNSDTSFDAELALSPVVNVSWYAAKKYCECQGKRLPTVAEWELAAKASPTKPDASNDSAYNQWILSWVSKPSPKTMPHIGSTFRNFYGIYDLHGLVWEWTYDFNSALTTGESRENSGLDNTFFCGGGSFSSRDINNYASFMRFAMRSSIKAKFAVASVGFRCVK